jgi:hypothetical protein
VLVAAAAARFVTIPDLPAEYRWSCLGARRMRRKSGARGLRRAALITESFLFRWNGRTSSNPNFRA